MSQDDETLSPLWADAQDALGAEEQRRSRLVQFVVGAVAIGVFMAGIPALGVAPIELAIIPFLFAAGAGLGLVYVRRGGDHRRVAWGFLFVSYVVLVVLPAIVPDIRPALLVWLLCLPINASLMLDWRAAVFWVVWCTLAIPVSLALEGVLPHVPVVPDPRTAEIALASVLCVSGGAAAFGEYMRRVVLAQLDAANHELRQARDAAQALSDQKSRFVANVSHEIRTVIEGFLNAMGIHPTVVHNGQEAVDAVKREPFDVVLMDVRMPVLDGHEATRCIRQMEQDTGGHIPIVALTASALAEDQTDCESAGMDEFLTKPLKLGELKEVLDRLFGA